MRRITIGVLSVAMAFATASTLHAQGQGRRGRFGAMGEGIRLRVLAVPKVQEDLKLTDDQKQKLRDIQQRAGQQMRELQQGEQEKRAQILKSAGDEAMAVLTAEQKEQFEKMKGAKIELPDNLGFGGGRRPQQ